jgi:hypothetical protein
MPDRAFLMWRSLGEKHRLGPALTHGGSPSLVALQFTDEEARQAFGGRRIENSTGKGTR